MNHRIKIEYEQIKEMRKDTMTPVDTMGCHIFKDDSIDKSIKVVPVELPSKVAWTSDLIEVSQFESLTQPVTFSVTV